MKIKRKIIEIDEKLCDGCGQCVPSCAEGAIKIVNGKAKLVSDKFCDGLGACIGECPNNALKIIEREAEDFNGEAVEEYLKSIDDFESKHEPALACGCPSSQIQSFNLSSTSNSEKISLSQNRSISALSHWPVQIKLVPPDAPFLKEAHLLVAADCTSIAYPNFHEDFIKWKVVLIGCPKFDDVVEYVEKFAEIFKIADIKHITVVVMEVPCCQNLPIIIKKGMKLAGKNIPLDLAVITTRGDIQNKQEGAPQQKYA